MRNSFTLSKSAFIRGMQYPNHFTQFSYDNININNGGHQYPVRKLLLRNRPGHNCQNQTRSFGILWFGSPGHGGDIEGTGKNIIDIISLNKLKMKPTIKKLKEETDRFFNLHWPSEFANDIPKWSEPWDLNGSIPNGSFAGCYVFIDKNDIIVYVGVAASKGTGIYADSGIGKRVGSYKKLNRVANADTKYTFKEPWSNRDIKELRTIGFPTKLGYLAYSLEVFLIRELQPLKNNSTNRFK